MRVLLFVALAIAAASATNVLVKESPYTEAESRMLFHSFKTQFNKKYKTKRENERRYRIFKDYVEFVRSHNNREAQGLETYKTAINHLCDLTHDEYRLHYLAKFNRTRPLDVEILPTVAQLSGTTGVNVDWRAKGAVTPVKNQGQCGSCWSFSTTGSVEGATQIATGKLVSLSEQQLMDCSTREGDHSCNGGLMDYAFEYIIKNGGLDSESDYPYVARDERCDRSKESKDVATIASYKDVQQGSEEQLQAAVVNQPISIAIEADQRGFQTYHSGVFTGPCGQNLDHGVLLVGFNSEGSQPYYIVKNSWGSSWGLDGYIEIAAGSNLCGISNSGSYPIHDKTAKKLAAKQPMDGPYEDPKPSGCASGEKPVQISGVSGDYCAPSCASGPCPASPSSAKAECVVETPGSGKPTLCALICTPGVETGECPGDATCKAIQGTGICTYDD